eukprot:4167411-Pyramimonas_sp.AAC.1
MRYDIVPSPPPRKLTATPLHKQQPHTTDYDPRASGLALLCSVGHMQRSGNVTRTTRTHWDPAGNAPFREFVRDVHAWIIVTTGVMTFPNRLPLHSV